MEFVEMKHLHHGGGLGMESSIYPRLKGIDMEMLLGKKASIPGDSNAEFLILRERTNQRRGSKKMDLKNRFGSRKKKRVEKGARIEGRGEEA